MVVTDANGCTGDVCVTVGVNATLTCQQPAGVIFTNVQTTEVTINWNPVNALSTQIQYRQQGVPGVNNSIAGAGISSKILTGLITGATYQCRLRHNCPDTGLTPWKYKPFMTSVLRSFDAAVSLEAYPNPTEGTLNVAITTAKDEALTLTVMSLLGEQLVSKSINLQEGVNLTKVDLSNYNSGIYLIQLEGENVKLYEKVMKVN